MVRYDFKRLDWNGIWRGFKHARVRYDDYVLRNFRRQSSVVIEGNAGGFVQMSAHFLSVASQGQHVHMPSKEKRAGAWLFESGDEVSIGFLHRSHSQVPKLDAFSHEAKPVLVGGQRLMAPGSECETSSDDGFSIDGNSQALVSLAQHCLDLAEEGTASGAELAYRPSKQLNEESIPFILKKV